VYDILSNPWSFDYTLVFGCELDGSLYYFSPRPKPAINIFQGQGHLNVSEVLSFAEDIMQMLPYTAALQHTTNAFQLGPTKFLLHQPDNTTDIVLLRKRCRLTSGSGMGQISRMDDYHYEVIVDNVKSSLNYFTDNDGRIIGWSRGNVKINKLQLAPVYISSL
jgi:hypothetical protein